LVWIHFWVISGKLGAGVSQGMVKVTGTMQAAELEVKRFYMPGVEVTATCPKCKREVERDLGDHYLSYPPVGKPFEESMYCDGCDHSWEVGLVLRIELGVAP
jgi:hypothetical protein